jgi:hypothetical protein
MHIMNKLSIARKFSVFLTFVFIFFSYSASAVNNDIIPTKGISCGGCISDGGLGYQRTCCENRIDAQGNTYTYCATSACLPGDKEPTTLNKSAVTDSDIPVQNPSPIEPVVMKPLINKTK